MNKGINNPPHQSFEYNSNNDNILLNIFKVIGFIVVCILILYFVQITMWYDVKPGDVYQRRIDNPFQQDLVQVDSIIEVKGYYCKYKRDGFISTCETSAYTRSNYKLIK